MDKSLNVASSWQDVRGRHHVGLGLMLLVAVALAGCSTTENATTSEEPVYQVTGGQFVANVTAEGLDDIRERVAGYDGAEIAMLGGSPPTVYVVRGLRSQADCQALSQELSTVDYLKEVGGCRADNTYEPGDGFGGTSGQGGNGTNGTASNGSSNSSDNPSAATTR